MVQYGVRGTGVSFGLVFTGCAEEARPAITCIHRFDRHCQFTISPCPGGWPRSYFGAEETITVVWSSV